MFCYRSLFKWLNQVAFPPHQIRQMNICQQSVPYYCHFALNQRQFWWVQLSLDFEQIHNLVPIKRLRHFRKQYVKEMFPVIEPYLRRLVVLIHSYTVWDDNHWNPHMVEIRKSVMDFFIIDIELIDRHEGIILVQHKIIQFLFINNLFHLTEMVNHGCGPEHLIVKQ